MDVLTKTTSPSIGSGITLTVNGETVNLPSPHDIAALAAHLGLDVRKVAIERNREIVPRSIYATTPLAAGDVLEIVHFIGGG